MAHVVVPSSSLTLAAPPDGFTVVAQSAAVDNKTSLASPTNGSSRITISHTIVTSVILRGPSPQ